MKMFKFSGLLGGATLAFALAGGAQASTYLGVEFPAGAISFADEVVSYQPGLIPTTSGSTDGYDPLIAWRNAQNALGAPDQLAPGKPCTDANACPYVSLGKYGSLTLKFTNNILTGSGTSAADLWIFEGGTAEPTTVHISSDGVNWLYVGTAAGGSAGVDIDPYLTNPGQTFSYVKVTDMNGLGAFNAGADIDAIGAISTLAVPEPASWALMIMGFGMAGAVTRSRRRRALA